MLHFKFVMDDFVEDGVIVLNSATAAAITHMLIPPRLVVDYDLDRPKGVVLARDFLAHLFSKKQMWETIDILQLAFVEGISREELILGRNELPIDPVTSADGKNYWRCRPLPVE